MKIKRPTPIVYDENYDESQITFMTETLIKKHLDYLKRVARPLGMTVKVKKLKSNNPNLDEQDNDLIDRFSNRTYQNLRRRRTTFRIHY